MIDNVLTLTSGGYYPPAKIQIPSLVGEWLDPSNSVPRGLVFHTDTLSDLMNGRFEAYLMNTRYYTVPTFHSGVPAGITYHVGGEYKINIKDTIKLEVNEHEVGILDGGHYRRVYVLDIGDKANLRAGLTVHGSLGSWSSYPPHKFEIDALMSPVETGFYEVFAYVTDPPMRWGVQVVESKNRQSKVDIIQDRQVKEIPLSNHPVVAAPDTQLAYFWAYTSKDVRYTEKFTAEGRV